MAVTLTQRSLAEPLLALPIAAALRRADGLIHCVTQVTAQAVQKAGTPAGTRLLYSAACQNVEHKPMQHCLGQLGQDMQQDLAGDHWLSGIWCSSEVGGTSMSARRQMSSLARHAYEILWQVVMPRPAVVGCWACLSTKGCSALHHPKGLKRFSLG